MAIIQKPDAAYDVVVIGGGTAGSNAARAAAATGATTLMVHTLPWWNLCVQRGCMPSKSLLGVADVALALRHACDLGISVEMSAVPFGEVLGRKDEHVARFSKALSEKLESEAYDILHGAATFVSDSQVQIEAEGETHSVSGKRFVIATGSRPFVPPIDGLADTPYITSDAVMENTLSKRPASIAILGGGPIGLEMATFFAGVGVSVTLIEMKPLLAPLGERFGGALHDALVAHGNISIYAPAEAQSVSYTDGAFTITLSGDSAPETVQTEALLVATGRMPAFDTLSLTALGITPNPGIACNASTQAVDAEHVYVAGDVTKDLQLLHVAAEEGRVAGHNAGIGAPEQTVDYAALNMSVIFSSPAVAHVGLTEAEATERGGTITETIHFPETGRAITMGVTHGCWSLTADAKTGEILGATIVGPRADDLIHEPFLAMRLGATVHDIARLFGYHPTLSEQFFALATKIHKQI